MHRSRVITYGNQAERCGSCFCPRSGRGPIQAAKSLDSRKAILNHKPKEASDTTKSHIILFMSTLGRYFV